MENTEYISKRYALKALEAIRLALWEIDIPSPTVPEYVEHHEQITDMLTIVAGWKEMVKDKQPADVVPVRHGHWTLVGWHKGMKVVECSCCKYRAIGSGNFCPNCGADMKREEKR